MHFHYKERKWEHTFHIQTTVEKIVTVDYGPNFVKGSVKEKMCILTLQYVRVLNFGCSEHFEFLVNRKYLLKQNKNILYDIMPNIH